METGVGIVYAKLKTALNDTFFVYSVAAMVLVQSSQWNAVLSSSVMQRLVTTLPSKSIHNHLLVSPGI